MRYRNCKKRINRCPHSVNRFSVFILFIVLTCFSLGLFATNTTWTGAVDYDWFNAGNWDNGVPGLVDTVNVISDSVTINAPADIKHLLLKNSAIVVSPAGKLRVNSSDGVGIICDDSNMYNYGVIRISSPGSIGLLLSSEARHFNFNGSKIFINNSSHESIIIGVDAVFENYNSGLVQSDTCTGALYNKGQLLNNGTIKLNYTLIPNDSVGSLENGGNIVNLGIIKIDSSSSLGLNNLDTIQNPGTIHVEKCFGTGVRSSGTMDNSGSLLVRSANDGIFVESLGSLLNTGTIKVVKNKNNGTEVRPNGFVENRGTFEILNSAKHGLYSFGRIENYNTINIDTFGNPFEEYVGIYNLLDTLYNDSLGSISINGQDMGLFGIYSLGLGTIENHGVMEIQKTVSKGIYTLATGRVENFGIIEIHNLGIGGIGMHNFGTIQNAGALIIRDLIHGISSSGVLNFLSEGRVIISNIIGIGFSNSINSYCRNEGKLQILDINGQGIINSGLIENADSIIIMKTGNNGWENKDSIINEATGVISIEASDDGLLNGTTTDSLSYFQNQGQLLIFNTSESGVFNYGIIVNDSIIQIDSVGDYGLINRGDLSNHDSIIIRKSNSIGVYNLDSLYNGPMGVIDIGDTRNSSYGLLNDLGHTLINDGIVFIEDVSRAGLLNIGDLVNNNTIEVRNATQYGIWNHIGTLTNTTGASIHVNGIQEESDFYLFFNENAATLINDGSIILTNFDLGLNDAGIKCSSGTTFNVTSQGSLKVAVEGGVNLGTFIDVDEEGVFIVEGILEVFIEEE